MKNLLKFIIFGVLLIVLFSNLYQQNFYNIFENKSHIELMGNNIKDFGTLKKGETAMHYFTFTNKSKTDLLIYNVETTCGCTVSSWNTKPIKTNMVDSIQIIYDSNISGEFYKSIFLYSNSHEHITEFKIKGNVID